MENNISLKPCPFCGGKANTYTIQGYMKDECYVACSMCEVKGPRHKEEKYAFKLWNDRATVSEQKGG